MRQEDGVVPPVVLREESEVPLYEQLFERLRTAIVSGKIAQGTRLPSTRALARDLSLSRTTTIRAYRRLRREGYVDSGVGSGTYVADELPEATITVAEPPPRAPGGPAREPGLSMRGQRIVHRQGDLREGRSVAPFMPGVPALDAFPYEVWRRIERGVRVPRGELGPVNPGGHMRLRHAIVEHLAATRGLLCDAEQVMITSGTRETVSILSEILLDPQDKVLMEDPGYRWVADNFERVGAQVMPVPVDGDGMDVSCGTNRWGDARLAYVTPSNQFPIGATLSLERRRDLVAWARAAGAWIIEDDYDSEYRFHGAPLPPIRSLGGAAVCTLYVNSFRKILFPALSLGFVVLPPELVKPFLVARAHRMGPQATRPQLTLARFMEEGHLLRHIRSMRRVYESRAMALCEALDESLASYVTAPRPTAGGHLVAWFRGALDDGTVARRAAGNGVIAFPLSYFRCDGAGPAGLVLGFGASPAEEIRGAVRKLRAAFP